MKLSTQEEYGIRCMLQVARHQHEDEPLTIERIAEMEGLTPHYTGKILRVLSQAGLVTAARGQRGGYRLTRPASAITLLEVFNALGAHFFEPETCDSKFTGAAKLCVHTTDCNLRHFLREVENTVERMLGGVTLQEMAAPAGFAAASAAAGNGARIQAMGD